eukprot:CAMPEP_0201663594 /NCGR_PEP_ID=MMETSP0494-20130426/5333_1 /ASSEMBLY_ACC=CAM_ASM_000839 /TAXON_ID=420259 /ORGANISM="Thalassiosira gravida, Strain GMp14c1" /LENGTH=717 /DNA_ID=CAMNT_0048142213 /DNA_START=151 /DNA_END=2304 /DNA_ORIENTATION=-
MATSSPPAQTTLLIGGSNGTATLCAILGDKSKPVNANHTLRVATRSSRRFLDGGRPRVWRCKEKKHLSDVISADFLPTRILTHVGSPDSVFVYGNDSNEKNNAFSDGNGSNSNDNTHTDLSQLEQAISGISSPDNGGIADIIVLACPVSAHLSLLRRIARAVYNLDARGLLGSSNRPPILIGSLYAAGGFDWMSRIAFFSERPEGFTRWKRPLGLFGLKAFPYLCKSLVVGEVSLHGRYPQLQVAVTPSNSYTRRHAQVLLDRVLQNATTGKSLEFLGLSSTEELGGDGTVGEESLVFQNQLGNGGLGHGGVDTANSARNAMMIAAQTHKQLKEAKEGSSSGAVAASMPPAMMSIAPPSNQLANAVPASPTLDMLLTQSLSDYADPSSALGFLTCTLNSTNQILHPCILVALFGEGGSNNSSNDDGTITWNPKIEGTPLPRFYADGAAKPLAGELITSIAGGEMYFVIDAVERLLSPRGYDPITALHGGEPVGRKLMNFLGNSPHELGERSGLTGMALRREWQSLFGRDGNEEAGMNGNGEEEEGGVGNAAGLIHRESMVAKCMSYALSHNSRLNAVLSPCIVDESSKPNEDGTIRLRPNTTTRFFTDDTQHGLCIYLGLAELLGFDLERDMKDTLYVVRRLQHWMKKEFVLPAGKANGNRKIVSSAKDVAETSAPQAFGIHSIQELRQFFRLDVFGEVHQARAEELLGRSGLVSRL